MPSHIFVAQQTPGTSSCHVYRLSLVERNPGVEKTGMDS